MEQQKIILTSHGLTNPLGRKLIHKELSKSDLTEKDIFLFHEPYYSIENMLVEACKSMGFRKDKIILSGQQKSLEELLSTDYLYVTEGNTFEIMQLLRERGLDNIFRKAFDHGATYIGASAGAIIAGNSIEPAYIGDRNFVRLDNLSGLGLFDGIAIPHFTDRDLEQYLLKFPELKEKHSKIYSIANDQSKVLLVK